MYRDVDFESYMFRIVNFTNSGTELKALPRLLDIYRKIDMKNILRLKSTDDSIELAKSVCDIVFKVVGDVKPNDGNGENDEKREGENEMDGGGSNGGNSGEGNEIDTEGGEMTLGDGSAGGEELNDRVQKQVERLFEKEKELLNGKTKKTKLTKKDKQIVDALSNSGSELVETGGGMMGKVNTVVIPELTQELIDSGAFSFLSKTVFRYTRYSNKEEVIADGLRLGTILGKKLKVRGEERDLIFTRQNRGKINKRLIAELGFDNSNVQRKV
jgi:hypothetical protein